MERSISADSPRAEIAQPRFDYLDKSEQRQKPTCVNNRTIEPGQSGVFEDHRQLRIVIESKKWNQF
jgi:hypothetical protein